MFYYYYVHLVVFVPDAEGNDPWAPIHIDTIDRFNQGSAGSGDVYIAHADSFPTEKDVHIFSTPSDWPSQPAFGSHLDPTGGWPRLYEAAMGDGSMYALWERGPSSTDIFVKHVEYNPTMSKRYKRPYCSNWNDVYSYKCSFEEASQYVPECFRRVMKKSPALHSMTEVQGFVAHQSDVDLSITSQLDSYLASREYDLQTYHRSGIDNSLFYKAYYTAIDKLPALQQNTFANILEIVNTIRSFADGLDMSDFRTLKKTSSDLWLRYRYQYNTTISDIEEVTNAVARLQAIMGKPVSTYGGASKDGVTATCQVKVMVPELSSINDFLRRINLRPTLVNVWDVIPYSFVVDWFFKVGPFLEDLQKWIDSPTMDITEVWYSVWQSRDDKDVGLRVSEYGRWRGNPPALPYFSSSEVSSKTIGMRIADAIALFL
jgi:hypothetical protein